MYEVYFGRAFVQKIHAFYVCEHHLCRYYQLPFLVKRYKHFFASPIKLFAPNHYENNDWCKISGIVEFFLFKTSLYFLKLTRAPLRMSIHWRTIEWIFRQPLLPNSRICSQSTRFFPSYVSVNIDSLFAWIICSFVLFLLLKPTTLINVTFLKFHSSCSLFFDQRSVATTMSICSCLHTFKNCIFTTTQNFIVMVVSSRVPFFSSFPISTPFSLFVALMHALCLIFFSLLCSCLFVNLLVIRYHLPL